MFRLSKKVEYSLLALQKLALNIDKKITAKELSKELNVSFEFLSKALQVLMRRGIVQSHQGIKGGYTLSKSPKEISVADVIKALEDNSAIVECMADIEGYTCNRADECTIKSPMEMMQNRIDSMFVSTTISDLASYVSVNTDK